MFAYPWGIRMTEIQSFPAIFFYFIFEFRSFASVHPFLHATCIIPSLLQKPPKFEMDIISCLCLYCLYLRGFDEKNLKLKTLHITSARLKIYPLRLSQSLTSVTCEFFSFSYRESLEKGYDQKLPLADDNISPRALWYRRISPLISSFSRVTLHKTSIRNRMES